MKKRISSKKSLFKKLRWSYFLFFVLISLLTLVVYYLLIKNAYVDETMLFSWAWIVNYLNVKLFFFLLVIISLISVFVARINFDVKQKYFLVIIFLIAFLLSSITWSLASPNPDIAEFFGVAKYVEVNGLFRFFKDFGTDALKGYRFHSWPVIMGLFFRWFSESLFVAHLLYSVLFAFIPVLTFILAKKLFNEKVAFISSFFVLSMPLLLIQSSMFLVDVPTVFFVLLSFLVFYEFLLRKSVVLYLLVTIVFLLTLTSKITAITFLFFPIITLLFHVKHKKGSSIKILARKSIIMFFVIFFLFLLLFIFKTKFLINQFKLDLSQANIVANPPHYVNSWSYFFQIQPLILFVFLLFVIFFLFKPTWSKMFLLVWMLFPLVLINGTTIRYMLPAFPAIAIGAAFIVSKLKKPLAIFIVSIVFLSSTLSIVLGYMPFVKNEFYDNNIRLAAQYINNLDAESVGVYMFYKHLEYKDSPKTEIYGFVFDYYSDKKVYFDKSVSVLAVYGFNSRFKIFDYYKDENYLKPYYDAVVVFSDVDNWDKIGYYDVKALKEVIDKDYELSKTFSIGESGIEKNNFGVVYVKSD